MYSHQQGLSISMSRSPHYGGLASSSQRLLLLYIMSGATTNGADSPRFASTPHTRLELLCAQFLKRRPLFTHIHRPLTPPHPSCHKQCLRPGCTNLIVGEREVQEGHSLREYVAASLLAPVTKVLPIRGGL